MLLSHYQGVFQVRDTNGEILETASMYARMRLFARCIDLGLYVLLWYFATVFITPRGVAGQPLLDFLAAGSLMLLVEGALIACFKTTPGKAILGLSITKRDGGKLSLKEAYKRHWVAMFWGAGLMVVPLYNVTRMYVSYKTYMHYGELPWDETVTYTAKDDRRSLRTALCALCLILLSAAIIVLHYVLAENAWGNSG